MAFACKLYWMHLGDLHRRGWLIFPDTVDKVVTPSHLDITSLQCPVQLFDLGSSVQPRVKPYDPPLRQLLAQPLSQ